MRITNILFLCIVLGLVLVSCAPPAVDMTALRQTIDDYNSASAASMMGGDIEKAFAFYADDAIEMAPNEPMIKGKEAIRTWINEMMKSGITFSAVAFTPTDVQAAGNVAYEIGTYDMTMTIPGMGETKDNGKYIAVWKMQSDRSWKVAAEIWNTDVPMPSMDMPKDAKK